MIRYLSLCSGIEAFSCAVHDIPDYEPVAFSEVEPFPCCVLTRHYPDVPNLGDMTQINGADYHGAVQLVVGGTPCQDFSTAGTRKGLAGERSGLALHFVRIVSECLPKWVLWENVPGCTTTPTSDPGRDFSTFVSAIHELGYCLAYRILDARFFGVPQRRRRIFLVGYLGTDWRCVAEVLFERESLRGDSAPRRETKNEVAKCLTASPCRNDPTVDTLLYRKMCPHGGTYKNDGTTGTIMRRDYKSATDLIVSPRLNVRRLTVLECERLMGFPDGYTDIPSASDTSRYKALGNSMAVPCMRWIGERILNVDNQISS